MRVVNASLTEALRRNADDLLAYFERRVVPRSEAGDLLAETMLQAWRRAENTPTDETEARMWLFGIAGNVALNHSRGRRRRNALADKLRQALDRQQEPDPAEAIAVRDAVARLDPSQAELVRLIHWDGFSITEAATIMGLNASTARGRYAAAKGRLRALIGEAASVT
ncbi:RNA polymerase subunit sigma-24 [Tessaracoccus aquimaris]|uniref:RNA polymerase subunit sigma-24 n=1 Tax=Tessaracoccus aquimaris TaxID=1332264 RepID=A0A1Q2CTK1_9ACTN|nr:RNA polymerase subunit sigma-24 [Tessaracoccus aquimaris]